MKRDGSQAQATRQEKEHDSCVTGSLPVHEYVELNCA
jgi:hypothetical protein